MLTRRGFLGAGAALCAAGVRAMAADAEKQLPIGIQLYSVRRECKQDFTGTLKAIGEMGYDGVEFAGYYGWDRKPEEFRKLLDDCGLKCCGTHTGLGSLQGDALKRTIALHQTLGNRFLTVPSLPGKHRKDAQAWLETAKLFNAIAAKAKPDGMRVGYHNHGVEFKPLEGGQCGWDIFFSNTSDDVVMQIDVGNCMGGGGNPVHFLGKYPGRAATVHCKEAGGQGVVGAGRAKWPEIIKLCKTTAGTEWLIVEFGGSPLGNLECAKRCLANLRKMTA